MLQQKTALLDIIRDEAKAIEQKPMSFKARNEKLFTLHMNIYEEVSSCFDYLQSHYFASHPEQTDRCEQLRNDLNWLGRNISPIKLMDFDKVCAILQQFYEASDLYLPDDTTWPYWGHWPRTILTKVTKYLTKPL